MILSTSWSEMATNLEDLCLAEIATSSDGGEGGIRRLTAEVDVGLTRKREAWIDLDGPSGGLRALRVALRDMLEPFPKPYWGTLRVRIGQHVVFLDEIVVASHGASSQMYKVRRDRLAALEARSDRKSRMMIEMMEKGADVLLGSAQVGHALAGARVAAPRPGVKTEGSEALLSTFRDIVRAVAGSDRAGQEPDVTTSGEFGDTYEPEFEERTLFDAYGVDGGCHVLDYTLPEPPIEIPDDILGPDTSTT